MIDKDDLRAEWVKGTASKTLAEKYGVTYRAVNSAAKKMGLPGRAHASQLNRRENMRQAPRERDEKLLRALFLRNRGLTLKQIEQRVRVPVASLSVELLDIRKADIRESGEPKNAVLSSYWSQK
ncbi:hypothetical protein PAF17_15915 [Paracoccus sp. Z330]|uniref:GcrA cell cycle regulator n=1 Tax=Paracoccus onchidii TaxID=3017813 RepID=A0ABT4ZHZ4_9RHOB|nr:hypothetical protein [Paracoccus onchidii]MDB6178978.1 hypothetical protein [Paracoccus onchidii]